ncbi:neural-cadherin-like [Arapaima gigas]
MKPRREVYRGHVEEKAPARTRVRGLLVPVGEAHRGSCPEPGPDIHLQGDGAADFRLVYRHEEAGLFLETTRTLERDSNSSYSLTALGPQCLGNAVEMEVRVLPVDANTPQSIAEDPLAPVDSELTESTNGGVTHRAPSQQLGSDPPTIRPSEPRKPRAVREELSYTVSVSEDVQEGDVLFTVPDSRFEKKWFEVVGAADSLVQVERESGRISLRRQLHSPADVLIRIHNLRANRWELLISRVS